VHLARERARREEKERARLLRRKVLEERDAAEAAAGGE
jgi:hypothetical protein